MSLKMLKAFLPVMDMSRQEKFRVMQRRRNFVVEFAKKVILGMGYSLQGSLKVPGAHAYEATCNGKSVRIGIKSCIDRWMAIPKDNSGEFGLLSKTEELFVIAMDSWPDAPRRLQIYKIDPKTVIEKAKKVHAEADRLGQTGQLFIPLDDLDYRSGTNMVAGSLQSDLELIFDETIEWVDNAEEINPKKADKAEPQISPFSTETAKTNDGNHFKLNIAQAKAALAANYGVSPDCIEITIRG